MRRTEDACQHIAPTKENTTAGEKVLIPQQIIDADARQVTLFHVLLTGTASAAATPGRVEPRVNRNCAFLRGSQPPAAGGRNSGLERAILDIIDADARQAAAETALGRVV